MMKNIENIITEEIENVINEQQSSNNPIFHFKERYSDSQFYNYEQLNPDYDIDINDSDITVYWKVIFALNDSGIESFNVVVDNIEGSFIMQFYNKNSDEQINELEKNINDFQWKISADTSALELKSDNSLYIRSIIFNFEPKTCEVIF